MLIRFYNLHLARCNVNSAAIMLSSDLQERLEQRRITRRCRVFVPNLGQPQKLVYMPCQRHLRWKRRPVAKKDWFRRSVRRWK